MVCNPSLFPQCQYNPATTACQPNPSFRDPSAVFDSLLYATIGVVSVQELAKIVCLLRYGRRPIPLHLRYFCGSSPLSVCLALVNRRKFLDELVYHEVTTQDHAWAFVWDGVMHNFLTFPLGLYFLLEAGRAGLDSVGVVAQFTGAVPIAMTALVPLIALCRCTCVRAEAGAGPAAGVAESDLADTALRASLLAPAWPASGAAEQDQRLHGTQEHERPPAWPGHWSAVGGASGAETSLQSDKLVAVLPIDHRPR